MDVPTALADIDAVLALQDPGNKTTEIINVANQIYSCILRYAPPGPGYRTQADRYIASAPIRRPGHPSPDIALRGVLTALRADVAGGRLATFEELIHANVYGDLLAQGDGLLRDGYARAATVVAGAALEEHIRLLAVKHGTGTQLANGDPKKASVMNSDLKRAGVYSEAQRAIVEGWQKLRNAAAHGEPGFDGADESYVASVAPMILGVRGYLVSYAA